MCSYSGPARREMSQLTGYWSLTLTEQENSLDTTHRKYLAVAWVNLLLFSYLECARFTLCTEHHAFCWILSLAEETGRLTYWRFPVIKMDFDIFHSS